jgi:hypothetical protein
LLANPRSWRLQADRTDLAGGLCATLLAFAQQGSLEDMAIAYDVIGDVHGHADRLDALLQKMGYIYRVGAWRHPERTAIYVGDLIDRGPHQVRTLEIVRAMIDAGSARATMGNHEFNAIAWATCDPMNDGDHLRTRQGAKGSKNRHQHQVFLSDVGEDTPQHREWIAWMSELPLWIEEPSFRVIHACWSPDHVEAIRPHLREKMLLTSELVEHASRKGHAMYAAIETLLKGEEVSLPEGSSFLDKDGHQRHEIRTQWWDPTLTTYRQACIGLSPDVVPDDDIVGRQYIPEPDRPTFIGHYWLNERSDMMPRSRHVACVDYSAGKGGPLVAYRFDGETELSADKFIAA